jgi:RNA polymerase subunit RPABC4/transcription elongation factor Spt4
MLLDIWDPGAWLTAAQFAGIIIGTYVVILWVALVAWTYRDVRSRSADPTMQAICTALVAIFFVPGLLLYVAVRPPETLGDAYSRKIEEEAFLREIQRQPACPSCHRSIERDFNTCPHCAATLRVACESCGEPVQMSWVACPDCGAAREAQPVVTPAPTFRRRTLEPLPGVSARANGSAPVRRAPIVQP